MTIEEQANEILQAQSDIISGTTAFDSEDEKNKAVLTLTKQLENIIKIKEKGIVPVSDFPSYQNIIDLLTDMESRFKTGSFPVYLKGSVSGTYEGLCRYSTINKRFFLNLTFDNVNLPNVLEGVVTLDFSENPEPVGTMSKVYHTLSVSGLKTTGIGNMVRINDIWGGDNQIRTLSASGEYTNVTADTTYFANTLIFDYEFMVTLV